MIASKDLMIGNWVYDGDKTQFPMFVQTIGEDYVYLNFEGNEGDVFESVPEDLQGIPITPELMEKIGFQFNGYGLWQKEMQGRVIHINISREFASIEAFENRLLDSRCTCHGIRCLHQLQNLFKTITKDELKIELWN